MKVVVAIDSLKGSLSSLEAGNAIKESINEVISGADVEVHPLAD
ncbi:TPA: glycerate kinase, partial [Streptococcus agalactiae]